MSNMKIWDNVKSVPKEHLKTIEGGRLKGMTDIKPQWRYQVMTEQFGPCGVGWKYEIKNLWKEEGAGGQVFAFAEVLVYIKNSPDPMWSEPIPGIGGSMLIAKESAGLYSSDEAFKMAVTDALSVALKMLGVGADVYMGMADSKYEKPERQVGEVGTVDGKEQRQEKHKEEGMQDKILEICMTIAGGDDQQAPGVLEEITKDMQGGPIRAGKDVKKLTGKKLGWCYAMAKTHLESWEKAHGKTEPVKGADHAQDDIPF